MKATSLSVSIAHYEKDRINYSSLFTFSQYDQFRPDPVSSLQLSFSFLISPPVQHPEATRGQNYNVRVLIHSAVDRTEDGVMTIRIVDDLGVASGSSIMTKIEYVDYVVARSVLSAIEEWTRSLETIKRIELPRKYARIVYAGSRVLAGVVAAGVTYSGAVLLELLSPRSAVEVKLALIVSTFSIALISFRYMLHRAASFFVPSEPFSFLLLNKGDEKNHSRYLEKRRRSAQISAALFTTGLLGFVSGLSVRWVAKKLGL